MTDEPSPIKEFLKTFFCTSSLWRSFLFVWAAFLLLFALEAFSIFVTPSYFLLPFFVLFGLLSLAFISYKKKNPAFLSNTKHNAIIKSGTTPQRFGVFLFFTIFFGPLSSGPAGLIFLKICLPNLSLYPYSLAFIGCSMIFSASLAAITQVEEFPEPQKTTYKGMLCWAYIILCLAAPVIDVLIEDYLSEDIVISPALSKVIDEVAGKQ